MIIKVDVVYVGVVRIWRHLKEELAWSTDKWFRVIRNIMSFKTVMPLSKLTLSVKQYCMHCYVVFSNTF